ILSFSVLVSAIIFLITGLSLEAYVGVAISLFIIKSGVEMIVETLNEILGQRADAETTRRIKSILTEEPEVRGAYDLILTNYGPDKNLGSVHLELPDTMTIEQFDTLTRNVQHRVYCETGVILTGIGAYSYNTSNEEVAAIRNTVQETVMAHDWALQLHGFYLDMAAKEMRFDVVTSFDVDPDESIRTLTEEIQELYPDYKLHILHDVDVSD
ncbi:MAG: cation transporter, partial [Firmicutes bacterium]|nr:cation transporter [Bacillota bacterium]